MAEYKSSPAVIKQDITTVYKVLANPALLNGIKEKLPAEAQEKLNDVVFEPDSIAFNIPPMGSMKIEATERVEPNKVIYTATSSPVPLSIAFNLDSVSDNETTAVTSINVDIPIFLKPMVEGKLKEACEKFGQLFSIIPFDKIGG